jgi:hypothetical protein
MLCDFRLSSGLDPEIANNGVMTPYTQDNALFYVELMLNFNN